MDQKLTKLPKNMTKNMALNINALILPAELEHNYVQNQDDEYSPKCSRCNKCPCFGNGAAVVVKCWLLTYSYKICIEHDADLFLKMDDLTNTPVYKENCDIIKNKKCDNFCNYKYKNISSNVYVCEHCYYSNDNEYMTPINDQIIRYDNHQRCHNCGTKVIILPDKRLIYKVKCDILDAN